MEPRRLELLPPFMPCRPSKNETGCGTVDFNDDFCALYRCPYRNWSAIAAGQGKGTVPQGSSTLTQASEVISNLRRPSHGLLGALHVDSFHRCHQERPEGGLGLGQGGTKPISYQDQAGDRAFQGGRSIGGEGTIRARTLLMDDQRPITKPRSSLS